MKLSTKLVLCVALFASICFASLRYFGAVQVVVRNTGSSAMGSTTVHVTGRDYFIGKIDVGQQRSVKVRPIGESNVEVSFNDSNGAPKRLNAGCYFEVNHYVGTIEINVANGELIDVQDDVSISIFF